jgi:hypothetical protein
MRIALLHTPTAAPTGGWITDQLTRRGHLVDTPHQVDSFAGAAEAGHVLADAWAAARPDLVLALGCEAGVAAQVAARDTSVPVVLRLTRAGRLPGSDRDRLETALARGCALVLVPSAGEVDRLVNRGVPRSRLRVLPEAVDRTRFADVDRGRGEEPGPHVVLVGPDAEDHMRARSQVIARLGRLPGCEPVAVPEATDPDHLLRLLRTADAVLATDDTDPQVSLVLQAMSCGLPVVAVDTGVLSDLVADGVTGLLVPRADAVPEALRSLFGDPMLRESMGLAAVDRVRARFDTAVVGAALERLLVEAVPDQEQAAAS